MKYKAHLEHSNTFYDFIRSFL